MQKFYIVGKDSPIYENHVAYDRSVELMAKAYRKFAGDFHIEAKEFYGTKKVLGIVPTEADRERFALDLRKKIDPQSGLVYFKINSSIGRQWNSFMKTFMPCLGIETTVRMPAIFFMNSVSHASEQRFMTRDGELYLSLKTSEDFEDPKDCTPIKGSEFYRKLEEEEALDAQERGENQNAVV